MKKCHTTYVTRYSQYEEEECRTSYKKNCLLRPDKVEVEEMVEVCRTPMVKNCSVSSGPEECHKVYESECWTKYEQHQVSPRTLIVHTKYYILYCS